MKNFIKNNPEEFFGTLIYGGGALACAVYAIVLIVTHA